MKYKITIQDDDSDKWKQEEIEAEPIELPGFDQFKFIIHEKDGLFKDGFVISELSTGGRVATGATKAKCVSNSLANLRRVGVEGFEKILKDIRKKVKAIK